MRVAVVDIGSNSIKLLVAEGSGVVLTEVLSRTLEVRISAGIGSSEPRLLAQGMERGAAAVAELAAQARAFGADPLVAVATSAVRDASNGQQFRDRVKAAAGVEIRILSGDEEAGLIGRGLTTDPALGDLRNFQNFDLGGGSLECLSFEGRRLRQALSLPLGCVRLTEKLVEDPTRPLGAAGVQRIAEHVRGVLLASGFLFPVPQGCAVVGTGGTLTTLRMMDAAARGVTLEGVDPRIEVATLRRVLSRVSSADLDSRKAIPGLSGSRADVFPTALATLLALAEVGGIQAFQHSLRNLRWGVAFELLSRAPQLPGLLSLDVIEHLLHVIRMGPVRTQLEVLP